MIRRRDQRGSALLTSVIVILVITVIGIGIIRFASREVAGATATHREQALVACAEAARQMLVAQFHLLGFPASVTALNVALGSTTGNGHTYAIGGHYDDSTSSSVVITQVTALADTAFGSSGVSASDITNTISTTGSLGGKPYKVVVHCQDGSSSTRQLEVEFGIKYGL